MDLELLESIALADDRARALRELIPGTDDHYFHWCLHHQNEGALDEVDALLVTWAQRHGETPRAREIRHRQAILRYETQPERTCEHLAHELGVRHDHRPRAEAPDASLPSRLDPSRIAPSAFGEQAFSRYRNLDGVTDEGLPWAATQSLDTERERALLARLRQPVLDGLVDRIAKDLDAPRPPGFGSVPIHRLLTRGQLDALAARRPSLRSDPAFVETYLARLVPGPDVDWQCDQQERQRYLERLWSYVEPLPPAFSSLKVNILYHWLEMDRRRGRYDRSRFAMYIALPRQVSYAPPEWLDRPEQRAYVAQLAQGYEKQSGLPAIVDDEALVRDYLACFFRDDADHLQFATWIREDYLARLFAETKILAGAPDEERWVSLLDDPGYFQVLRERVELELAPGLPAVLERDDEVALDVDVKNVRTLVVKIFCIQAAEHVRRLGHEAHLGTDVDGLVPSEERTLLLDAPALRRVRHRIALPQLRGGGVWVVELVGGGRASRVLVRKGSLRYLDRRGAAGHVLTILDEHGDVVRGASAWLDGREHAAGEDGAIVVPYTTGARTQKNLLLVHGRVASLVPFHHFGEHYALAAGFYVEREELVSGGQARVLVRLQLTVAGAPASVTLLERSRLRIASVDRLGTESSLEVPIEPRDGEELVHAFSVPPDARRVSFTVLARVRSVSEQKDVTLESGTSLPIAELDATSQIEALHLAKTDAGHVLWLLGKSGEPRPSRAVRLSLRHAWFRDPLDLTLATDAEGRVELGELEGIASISASFGSGAAQFEIRNPSCSWPRVVHARAGERIELPWPHGARLERIALLSKAASGFGADLSDRARLERGAIVIEGLLAGDYSLTVSPGERVLALRVVEGRDVEGLVASRTRALELPSAGPLLVRDVHVDPDAVVLELENAGPQARVHVFATRFAHDEDLFGTLGRAPAELCRAALVRPRTEHLSGREIGDEARYVLERRHATKYPGNLLPRPGLLLAPWAVRDTTSEVAVALAGAALPPAQPARAPAPAARPGGAREEMAAAPSCPALDFLAHPPAVLAGLRPDAQGCVRIDRNAIGQSSLLRAIVLDDEASIEAHVRLPEPARAQRDLRFSKGLDPSRHFAQRRQKTVLAPGGELALSSTGAKAQVCLTISDVHGLLATLSGDGTLREFEPIVRWPSLGEAERRRELDERGCHELFLFLRFKDRPFFDAVVAPHLRNKGAKSFLDEWLLDADLERWWEPARFGRLNTMERVFLAKRFPNNRGRVTRAIEDALDLIRRDVAVDTRLFQTAMAADALETLSAAAGFAAPAEEGAADLEMEVTRGGGGGRRMRADLERREEHKPRLWRSPGRTKEWAETYYYRRRRAEIGPELVPVNAFWRDLARHDGPEPFLSGEFVHATSSFAEMMGVLAVLDLPFDAAAAQTVRDGERTLLRVSSAALVFHEEIAEVEPAGEKSTLLVSQSYVQADDRYRWEGGEQFDKLVTGELLVQTVYLCQVALTNPTSAPRELDLLLQIPEGSIPVQNGFRTHGERVRLGPHATFTLEHGFYFPEPGVFAHFPAHAGKDGVLVASAPASRLTVVRERSKEDAPSFAQIARHGTDEELFARLEAENLGRLDPSELLWRLRDREVYERVATILSNRLFASREVLGYALLHRDAPRIAELLHRTPQFLLRCGQALASSLLTIDPIEDRGYEHLDYEPLFHARAHRLGPRLRILDAAIEAQYRRLLEVLIYRARLDDTDRLALTYYLLLQDRIDEGLRSFDRVDPERLATRLQYDYLRAYVCLYREHHGEARAIAERYESYPVERWRKRFAQVRALFDPRLVADERDRQDEHARLAAAEPALDFMVEGDRLRITSRGLSRCELRGYLVDVELLFSMQPFLRDAGDRFAVIEPHHLELIELAGGEESVPLPAALRAKSAVIELRAQGAQKSQASSPATLSVHAVEAYGRLSVLAAGAPLARAYVKVYARMRGGEVTFYKDGYTDVRGAFDYASLSTDELDRVERFAVLVASDEHGASIRELEPPAR